MILEVLNSVYKHPIDWTETKFIQKNRAIFTIIDMGMENEEPPNINGRCTDEECAAGLEYLLGSSFSKYHMLASDVP